MLASALQQSARHGEYYTRNDGVQRLVDRAPVNNGEYIEKSVGHLEGDDVGKVVGEYGELDTKIASLAALRWIPGYRAELALMSLGRAYTRRCCDREGRWTSGIHLLWWTRTNLIKNPTQRLSPTDFRTQSGASLERQTELAQWRLIMLRLVFISDVGSHAAAEQHSVSQLADLAERAALAIETPSVRKLLQWIRAHGLPAFDAALPEAMYHDLSRDLRTPW